jgi:hypothetical protein
MRRKKRWAMMVCGSLLAASVFTGCSQTQASTETTSNMIQFYDTTVTGTVKEIQEDTLLLTVSSGSIGTMSAGSGIIPLGGGGGNTSAPDGNAPDMPEGDEQQQDGNVPEKPSGETAVMSEDAEEITVALTIKDTSVLQSSDGSEADFDSISVGDTLTITVDEDGSITAVTIGGGMQPTSSGSVNYTALKEFTEDAEESGETYASTGTDENTIRVYEGADVTLKDITASRTSSDSTGGDNSSFYGVGADVLVTDGTASISGGEFTTDASGAAGIFAYDKGTVYVSDATIKTEQNTSGGIHVAGGGTLYAWDLNVETSGESSAAIRSDRGGGTMVVDGGNYVSNGTGSPAVYCTADIAVNNAVLTANGSEGICIEGLNSLSLFDCDLTGNMSDNEQNDCTWNVIVYQSMSGDSEIGNSTFNMTGGSITAENGGLIYTTNTECTMYMSGVDITYAPDNAFFLRCTGNANARGWGQTGNNGSQCQFTAASQAMEGDIIYDSISTLDFYMTDGSSLKGAIVDDETYAGNGGDGYCNVYISSDSVWTVTGDSVVTALYSEGRIEDSEGKTVSIIGTDGTVYVEGDSEYTIITGSYETAADMSGASSGGSFSDYQIEKPDTLK